MMGPQVRKLGPLGPTVRVGWGASHFYRQSDHLSTRDFATERPLMARGLFGLQHVAARLDAAIHGRDAVYRQEARHRAAIDCRYKYHAECDKCSAKAICDGFHGDYVEFFGTSEAAPMTEIAPTDDPCHFIKEQEKFVEIEDRDWAL
jgi:hypothetical protein